MFSCGEGLTGGRVGTFGVVSSFDAGNAGEITVGGVGTLRVVGPCTGTGPTAETAETGLPDDFEGATVWVSPLFPSLGGSATGEFSRVVD